VPSITIAEARLRPIGTLVSVVGTVTAEAGRIGTPALLAIGDTTGGIFVRIPDGATPAARGDLVSVTGPLADPYGQLEIRPAADGFESTGRGSLPASLGIGAAGLGEGTEGRLVTLAGTVASAPRKSTSGDLVTDLVDPAGVPFRIMTDASSGLVTADLRAGSTYRLTGIAGQRATKKGALDGYRAWLRDRADIAVEPAGAGVAATSPSPGAGAPAVLRIGDARRLDEAPATVEGVIVAGAGLLDADGRRIVIQDATGGIEVFLPSDVPAPALGAQVRVEGTVGRAWDAPRLRAATVTVLGGGGTVTPRWLDDGPSEAVEWQLVRVAGTIADVTRLGDRWRADLRVGNRSVLVTGLAGAGIASSSLVEGRAVTVVGIARRPYPGATDRRWTVVPRGPWDVAVGPAAEGRAASRPGDRVAGTVIGRSAPAGVSGARTIGAIDLAVLGEHPGETVRLGGLVATTSARGFTLDDGTALGAVELRGEAAGFLGLIEVGDALGIVGVVSTGAGGEPVVVVTDPAGIVRLGSLGEAVPIAAATRPSAKPDSSSLPVVTAGVGGGLGGPDPGSFGALGLVLVTACSLVATSVRRRRARRHLAARVAVRLGGLRRGSGAA
jgi:hypothetical protein